MTQRKFPGRPSTHAAPIDLSFLAAILLSIAACCFVMVDRLHAASAFPQALHVGLILICALILAASVSLFVAAGLRAFKARRPIT